MAAEPTLAVRMVAKDEASDKIRALSRVTEQSGKKITNTQREMEAASKRLADRSKMSAAEVARAQSLMERRTGKALDGIRGELTKTLADMRKQRIETERNRKTVDRWVKDIKKAPPELRKYRRELQQLAREQRKNSAATTNATTTTGRFEGSLRNMVAAAGVAVFSMAALNQLLRQSIELTKRGTALYLDHELAIAGVATAAELSKNAQNANILALDQSAEALQRVSGTSSDAILQLETLAISYGATEKQARLLAEASVDFAAATGRDFEQIGRLVARTLGGYRGELGEIFPQVGTLTQEQLKQGDAIRLLKEEYGGFADKLSETSSKQLAIARASFDDMLQSVGGLTDLLVDFSGVGSGLTGALDSMAASNRTLIETIENLKRIVPGTGDLLRDNFEPLFLVAALTGDLIKARQEILDTANALSKVGTVLDQQDARFGRGPLGIPLPEVRPPLRGEPLISQQQFDVTVTRENIAAIVAGGKDALRVLNDIEKLGRPVPGVLKDYAVTLQKSVGTFQAWSDAQNDMTATILKLAPVFGRDAVDMAIRMVESGNALQQAQKALTAHTLELAKQRGLAALRHEASDPEFIRRPDARINPNRGGNLTRNLPGFLDAEIERTNKELEQAVDGAERFAEEANAGMVVVSASFASFLTDAINGVDNLAQSFQRFIAEAIAAIATQELARSGGTIGSIAGPIGGVIGSVVGAILPFNTQPGSVSFESQSQRTGNRELEAAATQLRVAAETIESRVEDLSEDVARRAVARWVLSDIEQAQERGVS